ncbi:hypothetical protein JOQ06_029675 [Pogonophryne albipinna]|uniref:Uncharacterized protein n=1 Tax=Pogonophryne albipinna TaxID=1090488 RepID=A0AAD6FGC8_9TELE|nr:hypothetical protein JOQ06_029675 [Pogonophryne albipinna]
MREAHHAARAANCMVEAALLWGALTLCLAARHVIGENTGSKGMAGMEVKEMLFTVSQQDLCAGVQNPLMLLVYPTDQLQTKNVMLSGAAACRGSLR